MPPRRGAAADPDKKLRDHEEFLQSEEYKNCQYIFKCRKDEGHELHKLNQGSDDILDEWTEVLAAVFKLVEGFKVPGRKSKSYDQVIFRTMVFKKVEAEAGKDVLEIKIDGETHVVPVGINLDH